jgi:hypothetical protein
MELDQLNERQGNYPSMDRDRGGKTAPGPMLTRETAAQPRVAAAERMGSLATAAHHAASDLEEQFPQTARYVRDAANGFDCISNLLRDPNLDEVANLIGNLGRGQPAGIVAGVVLVGLALSWLMRTPGGPAAATAATEAGEGAYGVH